MAKDPFAERRGQAKRDCSGAASGSYQGGSRRPPSSAGTAVPKADEPLTSTFNRAASGQQQESKPPKLPDPQYPPPRPRGPGMAPGGSVLAPPPQSGAARPAPAQERTAEHISPARQFNQAAANQTPPKRSMVEKIEAQERAQAPRGPNKGKTTDDFNRAAGKPQPQG